MTRGLWAVFAVVGGALLLGGCQAPRPAVSVDPEIARLSGAARSAYLAGAPDRAIPLYRQALTRAELGDASDEIARNAYNLAVSLAATGGLAEAEALLDESLAASGLAGENAGNAYLAKARLARTRDRSDAALKAAQAALRAPEEGNGTASGRAQAHLLIAEICEGEGRRDEAWSHMGQARNELKRAAAAPVLMADAERVEATLRMSAGAPAQAGPRFDAQAEWLKRAGKFREMAAALRSAGEAYEASRATDAAADRYLRAARSLYAAGDRPASAELLRRTENLQPAVGNSLLRTRIELLARRLSAGQTP